MDQAFTHPVLEPIADQHTQSTLKNKKFQRMSKTQEEEDHALALLLSREAYYDDQDAYYGMYGDLDDDDEAKAKKKQKRKSRTFDDEWNPTGRPSKKAHKKQAGTSSLFMHERVLN